VVEQLTRKCKVLSLNPEPDYFKEANFRLTAGFSSAPVDIKHDGEIDLIGY
jgi:hypothetical protein